MRNLKKVLSLALALVMLLGMMVVGAGAVTTIGNFGDVAEISETHKEAIDLLTAIRVLEGSGGNFNPAGTLTRAEAAKIIATVGLGVDAAEALNTTVAPFSDVPANHWAAGYIAYCANVGVINGVGGNKFNPNGTVTGYQFAKMLLCTLGYGANKEYVGSNWMLRVAADVRTTHLDTRLTVTNNDLPREQAAQMAFNAINSALVTWSPLLGTYTATNTGNSNIGNTTLLGTLARNIFRVTPVTGTDALGYSTRTWKYVEKAGEITETYKTDTILATISGGTAGAMYRDQTWNSSITVYENGVKQTSDTYALGQHADASNANITLRGDNGAYNPGVLANNNKNVIGYTGQTIVVIDSDQLVDTGTQYTNSNNNLQSIQTGINGRIGGDGAADKILVITNYLAEVTKVNDATASADRSVDLKVYVPNKVSYVEVKSYVTEDYAKGDMILVTPKYGTLSDTDDYDVTPEQGGSQIHIDGGTLTDVRYAQDGATPTLATDMAKNRAKVAEVFGTIAESVPAECVTTNVPAFYPINVGITSSDNYKVTHAGSVSVNGSRVNYNGVFQTGFETIMQADASSRADKGYNVALGQTYAQDGYVLVNATYNFYMDTYGNVIGVTVANDAIGNYAYIEKSHTDMIGDNNVVRAILSDGTVGIYTLSPNSSRMYDDANDDDHPYGVTTNSNNTIYGKSNQLVGHIYAYTLEGSVITLTALPLSGMTSSNLESRHENMVNSTNDTGVDGKGGTITDFTKGYTTITTSKGVCYATDETVFIYYNSTTGRMFRYVGKDNAPTVTGTSVSGSKVSIATEKGTDNLRYARYVVILSDPSVKNTQHLYITDGVVKGHAREYYDAANPGALLYWYDAIVNGKKVVIATYQPTLSVGVHTYSFDSTKYVNGGEGTGFTVEPGTYNVDAGHEVNVVTGAVYVNASNSTLTVIGLPDTGDVIYGGVAVLDAKSGAPVSEPLVMGDEIEMVWHETAGVRYADAIYVISKSTVVSYTNVSDLATAMSAAGSGNTFTLRNVGAGVDLSSLTIPTGKTLYVEGTVTGLPTAANANSRLVVKTLNAASNYTVKNGLTLEVVEPMGCNLIVEGGAKATLTKGVNVASGTVTITNNNTHNAAKDPTLVINSGVTIASSATLTLSGNGDNVINGNVTGGIFNIDNPATTNINGDVSVSSGTWETGSESIHVSGSVTVAASGTLTITGGTVTIGGNLGGDAVTLNKSADAADVKLTVNGNATVDDLTITNATSVTVKGDVAGDNLTVSAGTVSVGGNVTSDVDMNAGTMTVTGTISGDIDAAEGTTVNATEVTGNKTGAGTVNAGGSAVLKTIDATAAATASSIAEGGNTTITVTLTDPADATVAVESSDSTKASVTGSGTSWTVNGVAAGTATITVTLSKEGYTNKTIEIAITVTAPHTHDLRWTQGQTVVAATCTTEGKVAYWTATCNATDKNGCTWDGDTKWSAEGNATGANGATEVTETTTEALGHDYEVSGANHVCSRSATCGDQGHTAPDADNISTYQNDESQHWKECSEAGCSIVMGTRENHDTNGSGGVCSVCGYDPSAT